MHCDQIAAWIKMPLGTGVGIGPCHIVLDGNPAPSKRGTAAPNFRPMSVVAKRLGGSRSTWYGGRSRPWSHCVRWAPTHPHSQRGTAPNFRPMSVVAKRL